MLLFCVCVFVFPVALPMVDNLDLFEITHNSMRVQWSAAEGASGYMILYAPLDEAGSSDEKEVQKHGTLRKSLKIKADLETFKSPQIDIN